MRFNSYIFVGFFLLVYFSYLLLRKHYKTQNILLLIASYIFYAYFDWRLLSILAVCTLINYFLAIGIQNSVSIGRRKVFLALAVVADLSLLGFFKYFNFFVGNVVHFLNLVGLQPGEVTLKILLPLGISFYTFMALGYMIDVYRGRVPATRNLLNLALFMSFFPYIASGPIGRAPDLLPQFASPRKIDVQHIDTGILLIIWGYFQKMVIADNLGILVDRIFTGYTQYQGLDVVIGILAFSVQIYCDFSGYTDIARGIAKLMGFDLMVNFKLPYFALNPRDFWSRWHISLSSWIRDYLYIPLGGDRKGRIRTYLNLGLTMLLCGLWHGAAWNYVIWGGYHGLALIMHRLYEGSRVLKARWVGRLRSVLVPVQMAGMFVIVAFGWLIFRCTSVHQFVYMVRHAGLRPSANSLSFGHDLLFFSLPLILVSLYQYFTGNLLAIQKLNPWIRIPIYSLFIIGIIVFGVRQSMEFIYFRF
jgi:alginate O-acetyltransferase complex protein AlgI